MKWKHLFSNVYKFKQKNKNKTKNQTERVAGLITNITTIIQEHQSYCAPSSTVKRPKFP